MDMHIDEQLKAKAKLIHELGKIIEKGNPSRDSKEQIERMITTINIREQLIRQIGIEVAYTIQNAPFE